VSVCLPSSTRLAPDVSREREGVPYRPTESAFSTVVATGDEEGTVQIEYEITEGAFVLLVR
jgi:hypothetical protein